MAFSEEEAPLRHQEPDLEDSVAATPPLQHLEARLQELPRVVYSVSPSLRSDRRPQVASLVAEGQRRQALEHLQLLLALARA